MIEKRNISLLEFEISLLESESFYSLFPIPHFPFPIADCPLPIADCPLPIAELNVYELPAEHLPLKRDFDKQVINPLKEGIFEETLIIQERMSTFRAQPVLFEYQITISPLTYSHVFLEC